MKYFLIGIKGSGMASLAHIIHNKGNVVMGSDIEKYIFTQESLLENDIEIVDFDNKHIKEDMIVIIGNSFDSTHPQVMKARELNLTCFSYVEYLAKLIDEHYSVCIAGTHGKTTTTSMMMQVMNLCENTGYLIGDGHGDLKNNDLNFVVESCEYKDNFLNYKPNIALINNIELDHVDYFKNMDQYLESFTKFSLNAKDFVVINGDDDNCMKLKKLDNYYYFGTKDHCFVQAKNIEYNQEGFVFDLFVNKEYINQFKLSLFGEHMLYNSLAVIAIMVLKYPNMDYSLLEDGLNHFKKASRRFDIKEVNSNIFVDDYAHHPTAIKLMIETCRQKYPDHKIISFFKPDRYSRILRFGQRIAEELDKSDEVYLCEFPSTSIKEEGIDIDMNFVKDFSKKASIINEDEASALKFKSYKNCVFLMMSSKDIYLFRDLIMKTIK